MSHYHSFSNSQFDGNLIQVRLPDKMIYPTFPVNARYEPFLRLLEALSPAQIEQMYLLGYFTTASLTPAQIPIYLEARRTNAISNFLTTDDKPLTDAQILAQPLHFSFSFQAVALFPDDETLPTLSIFDYGTGLIWDPLVGADSKALAKMAYEHELPATPWTSTVSITSDEARAATIDYSQMQATTIGATLDAIEAKLGRKVAFDANLYAKRVRAQPIIISTGRYATDELLTAVSASAGLQNRFYNGSPTLEKRPPQQPVQQLPPLVEQAQEKLHRLSLQSANLPFSPSRFEGNVTQFSELFGSEKFYLQAKLLNENTEGYDKIDLSKHKIRFANRIYFIARSGDLNSPFVTSDVQIW